VYCTVCIGTTFLFLLCSAGAGAPKTAGPKWHAWPNPALALQFSYIATRLKSLLFGDSFGKTATTLNEVFMY